MIFLSVRGYGKLKCQGKIREKSGNFEVDDKWQPCNLLISTSEKKYPYLTSATHKIYIIPPCFQVKQGGIIYVLCVAEVRYGYFFSDVDISRVDFFQLVWFMSV